MTGKKVSNINLGNISKGLIPDGNFVSYFFNDINKVILPMYRKGKGYVVIINIKEKKIVTKIKINSAISNIILIDTPFKK